MINGCHIGEVLHEDLEYCYITQPPHNVTLNTSVKFEGRDEVVPVKSTAIEITFAQVSSFFYKILLSIVLYILYRDLASRVSVKHTTTLGQQWPGYVLGGDDFFLTFVSRFSAFLTPANCRDAVCLLLLKMVFVPVYPVHCCSWINYVNRPSP